MMKRLLLLFLLPIFLEAASSDDWIEYHSQKGNCLLFFPNVPTHIKEQLPINATTFLPYDVYVANHEDSIFLLLVAHYPMELNQEQAKTGLNAFVEGLLSHKEEIVQKIFNPHVKENFVEFFLQTKQRTLEGKAFVIGNKLYLLAAESGLGYKKEWHHKFLHSFALKKN
jgi:hypothetical protein